MLLETTLDEYGVVHGRFQPLHNGHVHYIQQGLEKCKVLIIGITNADPSQVFAEKSDPVRSLPSYNPFTFFERLRMIQETLAKEKGIAYSRFLLIPLPIHNTERWKYYLPESAVHYINITSEWDKEKLKRMNSTGFRAEKIGSRRFSGITGNNVRQRMVDGGNWESLVPSTVESIVKSLDGVERVKKLIALDKLSDI